MDQYGQAYHLLELPPACNTVPSSVSSSDMSRSASDAQSSASSIAPAPQPVKTSRPRGRPPTRQPQIDGQLRFPCKFEFPDGTTCRKSFNRKSDKERHHHTHTNTRNHPCMLCDKAFIQTSALKVHVRTHTKEKPHHCGTCQKRFSDSSSLARHRRTHGPPQFACEWCQNLYKTAQLLQRHDKQCPKRPPTVSVQSSQYVGGVTEKHESAVLDHTQLWQPTPITQSKRQSSIPDNTMNMQFPAQGFKSSSPFDASNYAQTDDSQFSPEAEARLLKCFTPTSSLVSDCHSQDTAHSVRLSPVAYSTQTQHRYEPAQVNHSSQMRAVGNNLTRSQHMMQDHAAQLLQFNANYTQTNASIGMRNYSDFYDAYSHEDSVHSIYLDDTSGNMAVAPETDYVAQLRLQQPISISSHPTIMMAPEYAATSHQLRDSSMMDLMDPYKLGADVTGCGEPLPSEYDLTQS